MDDITASLQKVKYYRDSLFNYDPDERFSCYDIPLGQINSMKHIGLGNPLPLMEDIYNESKHDVEEIMGPAE
jgi:hypothetical protein